MKLSSICLLAATVALMASGCKELFGTNASANSSPVITGTATTNTPVAVAFLQEAQALNSVADPTPYEPLINTLLSGLVVLAGGLAGAYAHAHGVTSGTTASASGANSQTSSTTKIL